MRYYIRTHNGKYEVIDNKTDNVVAIFNDNHSLQNYLVMKKNEEDNIDKGLYDPSKRVKKDFSKILKLHPLDITPLTSKDLSDQSVQSLETDLSIEPEETLSAEKIDVEPVHKHEEIIGDEHTDLVVSEQDHEEMNDKEDDKEDDKELLILARKLQNFTKKLVENKDEAHEESVDATLEPEVEKVPENFVAENEVYELPIQNNDETNFEEVEPDYNGLDVNEPYQPNPKKLSKAEKKMLKNQ